MTTRTKNEFLILVQYFLIAVASLIGAEVMIFFIVYAGEGDINIEGYFRKNLEPRLFWLSVFFIIIAVIRLALVTASAQRSKETDET